MGFLKRLFVKLPLYILFFALILTGIVPLAYWLITGNDPSDFLMDIEDV